MKASPSGILAVRCDRCGCTPVLIDNKILGKHREQTTRETTEAFFISINKDKCLSAPSISLYDYELAFISSFLRYGHVMSYDVIDYMCLRRWASIFKIESWKSVPCVCTPSLSVSFFPLSFFPFYNAYLVAMVLGAMVPSTQWYLVGPLDPYRMSWIVRPIDPHWISWLVEHRDPADVLFWSI